MATSTIAGDGTRVIACGRTAIGSDAAYRRRSMTATHREPVTIWLARWRAGHQDALEHIVPLVYDELRQVARRQLSRERQPHPLSATTLVHETYLRLLSQRQLEASDRPGFLAVVGCTMRRILVDDARRRTRLKRGGHEPPVALEADVTALDAVDADRVLALDALLERLAAMNTRAARIVEYRVFAGLTLEETADALEVSVKTVQRTWSTARAWLRKELARDQVVR
jgi:RNA polymerase sigma factor (TIGR02999 family)